MKGHASIKYGTVWTNLFLFQINIELSK
jgi:hypothetical protein